LTTLFKNIHGGRVSNVREIKINFRNKAQEADLFPFCDIGPLVERNQTALEGRTAGVNVNQATSS
jgi:hypothetical protein